MGIITMRISSHPPISVIEPSKLQKLSGAQEPSAIVVGDEPIVAVATSVTKAVVMAPAIGAITPPLNTVPAVAPTAAPVATIPAFFIVPHPTNPRRLRQIQTLRLLCQSTFLILLIMLSIFLSSSSPKYYKVVTPVE